MIKFTDPRELVGEESCKTYQFKAEVDGVAFKDEARFIAPVGQTAAFASGHAQVGDTCSGEYGLYLLRVSGSDLEDAPSDFGIARQFKYTCTDKPAGLCLDRWYVRVRDAAGSELTHPMPSTR